MEKYLLHIDTTSSRGMVMLSYNGVPVSVRIHSNPMEHAAFVQPAIADLLAGCQLDKRHIEAVAVSNGPGSYTGLRVGLASAKGLCFAWNVPLITLSTLQIMAAAIQPEAARFCSNEKEQQVLLAPMIDARRMEVYFGVYHLHELQTLVAPTSALIDNSFLSGLLASNIICFTGDGSDKWRAVCGASNARFIGLPGIESAFARLAFEAAGNRQFAELAYAEPFYTKEFFNPTRNE